MMIKLPGPFSEEEAVNVIFQLARALMFLHETAGVAHRDVSVEHLLMSDRDHHWILCDYGYAQYTSKLDAEYNNL